MATCYTCDVQSGKVTSLREFALGCARAMGANILMRDEPAGAVIKECKPITYYRDAFQKAKADLRAAENMTLKEAAQLVAEKEEERRRELSSAVRGHDETRARYEAMLRKVEAWKPPTVDHDGLKRFMIQQLKESIDHDCYDPTLYYAPGKSAAETTPERYRKDQIASAREEVERCAERWESEQRRAREVNEWNRALVNSLPSR